MSCSGSNHQLPAEYGSHNNELGPDGIGCMRLSAELGSSPHGMHGRMWNCKALPVILFSLLWSCAEPQPNTDCMGWAWLICAVLLLI